MTVLSPQSATLESHFNPILKSLGYLPVRIHFSRQRGGVLSFMVEREDGAGMSIADCTLITNYVIEALESDDPIGGDYAIEVTSPGLDRPLLRPEDYKRFEGALVRVRLSRALPGYADLKRFQGKIVGSNEDRVQISVLALPKEATNPVEIPYTHIDSVNLVPVLPKGEKPKGPKKKMKSSTQDGDKVKGQAPEMLQSIDEKEG